MVRAKFQVGQVLDAKDAQGGVMSQIVRLHPVFSTSEENKAFWEATPTGSIEMTITNRAAFDRFVSGKSYYIDFTPAEG